MKIYGRDAWDGQLLASTWTSLGHRGERPRLGAGRQQQVEHEAFVTLLAERAGIPVLPIVAAGMATERDAVLVSEVTGRPLRDLDPREVDDALLHRIWRGVAQLHDQGMAHGHLDGTRLVVRPDGSPAFGDFADAKVTATDSEMMADQAQLLVTTALAVGPERAVSAAVATIGSDGLADALPFLQPAALDRETSREVRLEAWDLDDLMKASTDTTGSKPRSWRGSGGSRGSRSLSSCWSR